MPGLSDAYKSFLNVIQVSSKNLQQNPLHLHINQKNNHSPSQHSDSPNAFHIMLQHQLNSHNHTVGAGFQHFFPKFPSHIAHFATFDSLLHVESIKEVTQCMAFQMKFLHQNLLYDKLKITRNTQRNLKKPHVAQREST